MNKLNEKKYRLWTDTLNEENLCESFGLELEDQKEKNERGVESYKYKNEMLAKNNKKSKPKRLGKSQQKDHSNDFHKNHLKIQKTILNSSNDLEKTQRSHQKPGILKERLGPIVSYDESKSRSHIHANELDSDETVAKEIVRILTEPKDDVIKRCVKILGKKKCLELLYATEDIQQNGGMVTSDGNRKRTLGGVYFQLIKKDDTILNCQRSQIFIEEVEKKKKAKALKRQRQREKFDKAKKELAKKVEQAELSNIKNEKFLDSVQESEMIYFDE